MWQRENLSGQILPCNFDKTFFPYALSHLNTKYSIMPTQENDNSLIQWKGIILIKNKKAILQCLNITINLPVFGPEL
jgi:hypothetical protein